MNTAIEILGWLGWVTLAVFVLSGVWLVRSMFVVASRHESRNEQTDPGLPTCEWCGWVSGVNRDCAACQKYLLIERRRAAREQRDDNDLF